LVGDHRAPEVSQHLVGSIATVQALEPVVHLREIDPTDRRTLTDDR
jgi:hypothetical protein